MTRLPAGIEQRQHHRDQRADHPHQLQPGLEPSEGPTLVGLADVALDQGVERRLGHRARRPDGERDHGLEQRACDERAEAGERRPPARASRSASAARRAPAGSAPTSSTPMSAPAVSAPRRSPNHQVAAPSRRSPKAQRKVRNPSRALSTDIGMRASSTSVSGDGPERGQVLARRSSHRSSTIGRADAPPAHRPASPRPLGPHLSAVVARAACRTGSRAPASRRDDEDATTSAQRTAGAPTSLKIATAGRANAKPGEDGQQPEAGVQGGEVGLDRVRHRSPGRRPGRPASRRAASAPAPVAGAIRASAPPAAGGVRWPRRSGPRGLPGAAVDRGDLRDQCTLGDQVDLGEHQHEECLGEEQQASGCPAPRTGTAPPVRAPRSPPSPAGHRGSGR